MFSSPLGGHLGAIDAVRRRRRLGIAGLITVHGSGSLTPARSSDTTTSQRECRKPSGGPQDCDTRDEGRSLS
jgi:hypothetical protein